MQERKSKMNAAIMESTSDKKEKQEMLQTAVNRFLDAPQSPEEPKSEGKNSSYEKEVICLI